MGTELPLLLIRHKNGQILYEKLVLHLLKIYIDDTLTALDKMKLGIQYDPGLKLFTWTARKQKLDRNSEKSIEELTMEQFTAMASSIFTCINFTFDLPCLNASGMMPLLDCLDGAPK